MNLELDEDVLAVCQQLLVTLALLVALAAVASAWVFNQAEPAPQPTVPPAYGTTVA